jgi:plastocyanin domain-containing protein
MVHNIIRPFAKHQRASKRNRCRQRQHRAEGRQQVTITVDGGYNPARIRVVAGQPLRLTFHRVDPSSCVAQVIFPDFQRSLDLPLEASTSIDLLPEEPGLYPFHCGMNMVRGVLEVVAA